MSEQPYTSSVLMVGIGLDQTKSLMTMPIQLIVSQTGKRAGELLRKLNIDTIVSSWNLPDMPGGMFLKRVRSAKPSLPTIAIIDPDDIGQELEARSLGVSVVLSCNVDSQYFRAVLHNLLGLKSSESITEVQAVINGM